MAHVITNLCVCYGACVKVCPVDCIVNGQESEQAEEWPQYYIDPDVCIDCGACIPECPFAAIYTDDEVPSDYLATGGEYLNLPKSAAPDGELYITMDEQEREVRLLHTRRLAVGEEVDFSLDIQRNAAYFKAGPGYRT